MFYFIHVLAGIAIARYILKYSHNIYLSIFLIILLSITSHFLLDAIPHWDLPTGENVFDNPPSIIIQKLSLELVDMLLAASIALLFFYKNDKSFLILIAAFFSIFPDLIRIGFFIGLKNIDIFSNYLKIHGQINSNAGIFLGITTQVIITILLIILIIV